MYCTQIAKIISEMNGITFNFTQKMRCLYFLSHHKYEIPFAIHYCHIIITVLEFAIYQEPLRPLYIHSCRFLRPILV